MDRGAWQATVHGVTKVSDFHSLKPFVNIQNFEEVDFASAVISSMKKWKVLNQSSWKCLSMMTFKVLCNLSGFF